MARNASDGSSVRAALDLNQSGGPRMLFHEIVKIMECGAFNARKRPDPMNVVRRLTRALGLSVLLAVFVWTGSTASSQAAGYWTCTGGAWSAVGNPQHATPLKSCGSHLEIPRTQRACENAGGRWGRAGLFPKPICTMPTHDGGRPCADIDECEGSCLADLTPAQRDLLMQREKLEILGKCTPSSPVFGCMALVKEGFVSGLLCKD